MSEANPRDELPVWRRAVRAADILHEFGFRSRNSLMHLEAIGGVFCACRLRIAGRKHASPMYYPDQLRLMHAVQRGEITLDAANREWEMRRAKAEGGAATLTQLPRRKYERKGA